ncbi:hypothetical protein SDC9_171273 [bioreactor metagenome]|uniref:Uncharacterized protein n=1 Tax=bioreactor metagenome TaxID=1076179 RepID=A0A645GCS8_9ZZZZ
MHAIAAVLHGFGLHLNAPCHKLGPLKNRRHPVKHMVPRFAHIVRHLVFKGQHSLHVHIPGSGNQVFLVGVFPCKLIAQQVAAVVKVFAVYKAVFHRVPAGGLHLPDFAPWLCGHGVRAYIGIGRAAPAQKVQGAVFLKGGFRVIRIGKRRQVII